MGSDQGQRLATSSQPTFDDVVLKAVAGGLALGSRCCHVALAEIESKIHVTVKLLCRAGCTKGAKEK